jgi:hypothetical protein
LSFIPVRCSSKQADNKVQNDCKHNANYDRAHYRKEELKVSPVHEYVTGKPAQKGDSLPEEQQQAEEDEENSCEDYGLAYTLKIHSE